MSSAGGDSRGDASAWPAVDAATRARLQEFRELIFADPTRLAEAARRAADDGLLGPAGDEARAAFPGAVVRWIERLLAGPYDETYPGARAADAELQRGAIGRPEVLLRGYETWLAGAMRVLGAQVDLSPERRTAIAEALLRVTFFDAAVSLRHLQAPSDAQLEALQELNDRIVAAVPAGIVVVDGALRVQVANPAFLDGLELHDKPAVGMRLHDLLPSSALLAEVMKVRDTGVPQNGIELRLPSRKGWPGRPARVAIQPLRHGLVSEGGAEHGLLLLVQDLTEAEQIKAQALEAERRLQELVEHAADAVLLVDQQGRLTYINAAAERMFGFRRDELHGVDARVVLPDGFFTPGDRHLARRVAKGESLARMPVRAMQGCRKDGTPVPVEGSLAAWSVGERTEDGVIYAGVLRDVSVRRRAEEALRRSEASFRALIENSPDGLGIHRDFRYVYVNSALQKMLGYSRAEDLIGRAVLETVHPDHRESIGERTRLLVLAGGASQAADCQLLRADGSPLYVELVALSVIYDGAPAVVFIARDVHERKAMQARARQADRIHSVGTLAAGVAHEINNPLTYVITNLGFIARELGEIQERLRMKGEDCAPLVERMTEVRQAVAEVRDGTDRVRVIVRDLRTFSRSDDERRGRIDVRGVIETSVTMTWNHIRQCARLVKDYHDVPPVEANEARLGQVFLNLLMNAAQAIAEGHATQNEIRITTKVWHDGRVCVEVTDTGVGIAPETRARMFDPFFTTKPIGIGIGLGLSVCNGIITALNGEMEVESEVGKGSTFRVLLPPAPPDTGTSAIAIVPEPVARRGRILVVDDEPTIGVAVGRALGAEHDVQFSSNARDALRRLVSGEDYEVILCDLMMPEMTGMDLHAAVEKLRPEVVGRLVFLTGGAFTPRAKAFLDQVPNARLDKPFEEDEIRLFVRDRLA